ncbi:MAG TPA: acetyl-CoA carboxylase biotin carboxyl carrier protein [Candidatus Acidoferrales bacterium]|nr:acetyl-CoA carboxylase biotin carboxyl carrier protein [Candidatus Acidoferrales bacterium]
MEETSDPEMETLQELLALMKEHDLDRLKVKRGDAVYELVRRDGAVTYAAPAPQAAAAAPSGDPGVPVAGANVKKVVAPLTGVFYRSPSPDTDSYVEIGSHVSKGDVICILEAMKLFNEIQSDHTGQVVRIVAENGELVSQGEELFWIEP